MADVDGVMLCSPPTLLEDGRRRRQVSQIIWKVRTLGDVVLFNTSLLVACVPLVDDEDDEDDDDDDFIFR